MARLWFILGLMVVVLTVYTLVECAMFDRNRIRGLPRVVWIFVILFVPVIGPLLWLIVGRGRRRALGGMVTRSSAPDDDPDFLKRLDLEKTQQQRIRQLEKELADLDDPDPRGGPPTGAPPKKADPGEGELPGRRDA
jgi:hypothetical protein